MLNQKRDIRQINEAGLKIIKDSESLRLKSYQDNQHGKVWTIGWGHTGPDVKPGMKISKERADELLLEDISDAAWSVQTLVRVPLSDNQFSALVSFVYNIGHGHFKSSTLLRKLNSGMDCSGEFGRWIRDEGVIQPGLVTRRAKEKELFLLT